MEATDDCPITLTAQSSDFKLNKIEQRVPYEFLLEKDQVIYFMYSHYGSESYKISSLEKYGDVEIFATRATHQVMDSLLNHKDQLDLN